MKYKSTIIKASADIDHSQSLSKLKRDSRCQKTVTITDTWYGITEMVIIREIVYCSKICFCKEFGDKLYY